MLVTRALVVLFAFTATIFPRCHREPCPGELTRIDRGFESICPVRCRAHPNLQCYPGGVREVPDSEELPIEQRPVPQEGSWGTRHVETPAERARAHDAHAD